LNKFFLILFFLFSLLMLKQLYTLMRGGRTIIKLYKSRSIFIIFFIMLLIWSSILLYRSVKGYVNFKNDIYYYDYYINEILDKLLWIELSILGIVDSYIGPGIRENGLYIDRRFYKWARVQSYTWTSSNTIQFKIKTLFNANKSFDIIIKEDLKSKVDEAVQNHIHL